MEPNNDGRWFRIMFGSILNLHLSKQVMVWIYGGGFNFGGTAIYDGRQLAGLQDVVVVTITYRLSVLGFLSFGKGSKWPGNVGMLDQVMALQ